MSEYVPTSPVGIVRLLVSDVDPTAFVFSDDEISAFITLESGDLRTAAAQALDTIASNEALAAKVIKTLDIQTNGPALAVELRARATSLREQARSAGEDYAFEVAEMVVSDFGARQVLLDTRLREG